MNNANMKLIAVAVALIIVAASAATYIALSSDKGNDDGSQDATAQLLVYGNANSDHTIGQEDLDLVNAIIAGSESFDDHPFADANADGFVDQVDAEIIQRLIDRQPTTVYVYSLGMDERFGPTAVEYPLSNVVVHRNTPPSVMCQIGAADKVAGYFEIKDVSQSALKVAGAVDLEGSAKPSDASWQKFMDLDVEVGVGAIFSDASVTTLSARYGDIEAAGIPLIRLNVSGPADNIAASVTMGFLCGTDTEASALEYAELCWDTFDEIGKLLSGLSDDDRKVVAVISRAHTIAHTDSNFTMRVELAGAVGIGDVSPEFAADYPGDGSTSMQSNEALSNYDDYLDAIVYYASEDFGEDEETYAENVWTKDKEYYENLRNYENMVVVNAMMPIPVQVAYTAAALYPELVSMDWADYVLASFYGVASPCSYTFEDIIPVFTYGDYVSLTA